MHTFAKKLTEVHLIGLEQTAHGEKIMALPCAIFTNFDLHVSHLNDDAIYLLRPTLTPVHFGPYCLAHSDGFIFTHNNV